MYTRACHTLVLFIMFMLMACQREPHIGIDVPPGQGTLAVGLKTTSDITVGDVQIFIFDKSGLLICRNNFDNPRTAASHIHTLSPGLCTIIVTANANRHIPEDEPTTLAQFSAILKSIADRHTDLLSGMTSTEITAGNHHRVDITLMSGNTAIQIPTLHVVIDPPIDEFPEYAARSSSPAGQSGTKCIAELRMSQTSRTISHIATVPETGPDGKLGFDITAPPGKYDVLVWAEPANEPSGYLTDRLDAVVCDISRDATGNAMSGSHLEFELATDTSVYINMVPAVASYRIIATDFADYVSLSEHDSAKYPPISHVDIATDYSGYFPSEFDVTTGKVTDAITGFSTKHSIVLPSSPGSEVVLLSASVFAHGPSAVTATITVTDSTTAREICRIPGIRISYDAGHQTTIRSKFFTRGINPGGITIDTDWDEITIHF